MVPVLGGPNATMEKPLAEYVKNILRGRDRWGVSVRLTKLWAQLPAGQLELSDEDAMPRRSARRARAPPTEAVVVVDLFADSEQGK